MSRKNKSFSHENDVTTFREDLSTDTHWLELSIAIVVLPVDQQMLLFQHPFVLI